MSRDRIGGGRPPQTPDIGPPAEDKVEVKKTNNPATNAAAPEEEKAPVDQFERSVKAGAQLLGARLAGLEGKSSTKIRFSNEDLAYLASMFAAILVKNPAADRAERARLFTRAILNRLKKLSRKMSDAELEDMCETIGDVLDSSPVFGQLVNNVTDGANKMNQK